MKKLMFSFVLMTVCAVSLFANPEAKAEPASSAMALAVTEPYSLSGNVQDMVSHETLAGVTLWVNSQKVYTDFDGNFSIPSLCEGECELKVSFISYQEQTIKLEINKNERLQIYLQQR